MSIEWSDLERHKAAAKAEGLSLRDYARRRHLKALYFAQDHCGSVFAGIAIAAVEAEIKDPDRDKMR